LDSSESLVLFIGNTACIYLSFIKNHPSCQFHELKQGFFWNASRNILFDLYFVAPFEEIIYRGFLMGTITKWGLTEKKTFWVTMIVFWLIHIWEYPSTPYVFFNPCTADEHWYLVHLYIIQKKAGIPFPHFSKNKKFFPFFHTDFK